MKSVIIFGPPGTGKTTHAQRLAKHFGCIHINDGWDGRSTLKDGTLALTNEQPPFISKPAADVYPITHALLLIGVKS